MNIPKLLVVHSGKYWTAQLRKDLSEVRVTGFFPESRVQTIYTDHFQFDDVVRPEDVVQLGGSIPLDECEMC